MYEMSYLKYTYIHCITLPYLTLPYHMKISCTAKPPGQPSRYLNRTSACCFRTITSDGGGRRAKPFNNWPRYSIKIPRRCLWIALVRRAAWPLWPALRQRRFLRWAAMTPATLAWNLSLDRLLPLDGAGGGKGGIHSLASQVLLLQWNKRVALA